MRLVPNGTVPNTWAYFTVPTNIGKVYTFKATCRLSGPLTGTLESRARRLMARSGSDFQSPAAPNTVGVTPLSVTFTAGAESTLLFFWNGATTGGGDVWWDNAMLVEGTYTGDYIDGSKSFSKWDGTSNASTSVGYPPQLLDIAGKPNVDLTGVQSISTVAVDPYAARTFYMVYEVTDTTGNFQSCYVYGNATNRMVFQTSSTGSSVMVPRVDTLNGSTNITYSMGNGSRFIQRHVGVINFKQGIATARFRHNGNFVADRAYTPGDGMPEGRWIAQTATGLAPVRGLLYYADHDDATQIAISRYLGNKYGASIA